MWGKSKHPENTLYMTIFRLTISDYMIGSHPYGAQEGKLVLLYNYSIKIGQNRCISHPILSNQCSRRFPNIEFIDNSIRTVGALGPAWALLSHAISIRS